MSCQVNTSLLHFGRAYLLNPDGKTALEQRAAKDLNCSHTKRGHDRAHVISEHLLATTLNYIQEQEPVSLTEQFFKWKQVGKQKRRTRVDRDQPFAILLGVPRTNEEVQQRPLKVPYGIIVGNEAEQLVREDKTEEIPFTPETAMSLLLNGRPDFAWHYRMIKDASEESRIIDAIPEPRKSWVG